MKPMRLDWEDRRLLFPVREPFISRHLQGGGIAALIVVEQQQTLELDSLMPSGESSSAMALR